LSVEDSQAFRSVYIALKEDSSFDWKQNANLVEVARKIDVAKASLNVPYIFVRFSSRSPKDAVLNFKGKQILIDNYSRLKREYAEEGIEIDQDSLLLHALYILGTEGMRLTNGEQAVELFNGSERVQGDLDDYIQNPTVEFNMMVREYANFEVELEFRGFVYDDKLTAITQYNEFCYFPRLARYKDAIVETMVQFTQEMVGKFTLKNYVVDFILISKTPEQGMYSNLAVWVVEINPFGEFAGAGLFTWTKDMATLKGRNPFEFRYVETPVPKAIQNVGTEWREFATNAIAEIEDN